MPVQDPFGCIRMADRPKQWLPSYPNRRYTGNSTFEEFSDRGEDEDEDEVYLPPPEVFETIEKERKEGMEIY